MFAKPRDTKIKIHTGSLREKILPVEYTCVQSAVVFCTSSSWGSSMFSSTTRGTSGSHWKIRSSVVCDTEGRRGVLSDGCCRFNPEETNLTESNVLRDKYLCDLRMLVLDLGAFVHVPTPQILIYSMLQLSFRKKELSFATDCPMCAIFSALSDDVKAPVWTILF